MIHLMFSPIISSVNPSFIALEPFPGESKDNEPESDLLTIPDDFEDFCVDDTMIEDGSALVSILRTTMHHSSYDIDDLTDLPIRRYDEAWNMSTERRRGR